MKKEFSQIYISKIIGKLVKINFIFRFYLPIFSSCYSACFSMQHCFQRLIIHFLINTLRIFYIKFHHRNTICYLFSPKFFRLCLLFVRKGVWDTGLALKLSKSFNFQGLIDESIEQLSLNPRKLKSLFRQKKTPVSRVLA